MFRYPKFDHQGSPKGQVHVSGATFPMTIDAQNPILNWIKVSIFSAHIDMCTSMYITVYIYMYNDIYIYMYNDIHISVVTFSSLLSYLGQLSQSSFLGNWPWPERRYHVEDSFDKPEDGVKRRGNMYRYGIGI